MSVKDTVLDGAGLVLTGDRPSHAETYAWLDQFRSNFVGDCGQDYVASRWMGSRRRVEAIVRHREPCRKKAIGLAFIARRAGR
jgi:hypothetical protein